jgi:hypothetical protein
MLYQPAFNTTPTFFEDDVGRNLIRRRLAPVKPRRCPRSVIQAMGEHVAYFKPSGFLSVPETGGYPYCGVLRGLISGTFVGR